MPKKKPARCCYQLPSIFFCNRTTRFLLGTECPTTEVYIFQCSLLSGCRNMMTRNPKFASGGKTDAVVHTHQECVKRCSSHIVRLSGQRREAGDSRADPNNSLSEMVVKRYCLEISMVVGQWGWSEGLHARAEAFLVWTSHQSQKLSY